MAESVLSQTFYPSPGGQELPLRLFSTAGAPRGAVLLFHGGGWLAGGPAMFDAHGRMLADRGLLVASAGYRLLGQGAASLADCVDDAVAAAGFFTALAAGYGLGPERIGRGGGSAGGQLALA
ncbi:alpha/beta hydrolase fold domain-containing protein, partial [Catenulispora sp. NF23]|uniref:alpha/beta hydrolase n=1 Tax=Catenulispora pinistramenti TaxID=2705254 RepID=UPI001BA7FF5B